MVDSVSLFPFFLIDKVPLRFFYNTFFGLNADPDKYCGDYICNVYGSYRYKHFYSQDVFLDTEYRLLDRKMHIDNFHDIQIKHNIKGYSNMYIFGIEWWAKDTPYYFSIDAPIVKNYERMKILDITYASGETIHTKSMLEKGMHLKPNGDITLSNIDLCFGSDARPGKYVDVGYYLLLTTPNIIGPALCAEYKVFVNDTGFLKLHGETLIQIMPREKTNKEYKLEGTPYFYEIENASGDIFYSESMLDLLYKKNEHTLNLGYSVIFQKSKRTMDVLHRDETSDGFSSADLPRERSTQALQIVFGGYHWSRDDFTINIQASLDKSFQKQFTPEFYDFLFLVSYNF
jgi:hypothetical protein